MEVPRLDYRTPGGEPRRRHSPVVFIVLCAVLMPPSVLICVRIEMLNGRAGRVLPRTGPGKWRASHVQSEGSWRRLRSMQSGDATWQTRPLTPAEDALMRAEVGANVANSDLRDLVSTVGLLQYLLVPALLVCSLQLFRRRESRLHVLVAAASFLSAATCGGLLFHRSYFSSLGW